MNEERYLKMQRAVYDSLRMNNHLHHNENPDLYQYMLDGNEGAVALDYGCGKGRNMKTLLQLHNWEEVIGVDICQHNLDEAKKYVDSGNASFVLTDGDGCRGVPDNHVDLIISTICLQHICSWNIRYTILRDFYRILKAGGKLKFQMGYGDAHPSTSGYWSDNYEASNTNGFSDVRVEDPLQVRGDLNAIGFKDFKYNITKSFSDRHKQWIWVEATR